MSSVSSSVNIWLKLFAYWEILHAFLSSADFFENPLFRKIISVIPSECQTVWIQIRPDILSGVNWVQTVCKGYQQTTQVGTELIHFVLIRKTLK